MAGAITAGRPLAWLRRYGPPEALGTLAALLGAAVAHRVGGEVAAAVAANWAEFLAYYGVIAARDLLGRGRPSPGAALATVRDMAIEFGPAELLNLTVVRNAALLAGIAAAPSVVAGVLAGKLVADLLFYLPAIISHELLRSRRRVAGAPPVAEAARPSTQQMEGALPSAPSRGTFL